MESNGFNCFLFNLFFANYKITNKIYFLFKKKLKDETGIKQIKGTKSLQNNIFKKNINVVTY